MKDSSKMKRKQVILLNWGKGVVSKVGAITQQEHAGILATFNTCI